MDIISASTKIHQYIEEHKNEMFELLEKIVNMDSFTTDGEDVNKVGEVLTDFMQKSGFQTEKLAKAPIPEDEPWMKDLGNVFSCKSQPNNPYPGIVFLGHLDTVFPKGTVSERPFTIIGDKAFGPGVVDMKSGIIANIFAAKAIHDLQLTDVPLTVMLSPDEELGSPSTFPIYKNYLKHATAAICSEPGTPGGGVTVKRKGSGHFQLIIEGVVAHAAREYEKGASAIVELAHKILDFDKCLDLAVDTTVNTGLISGGISANSVAPVAQARIHITYENMERGKKLLKDFEEIMSKTYVNGTHSKLTGGLRLLPLVPSEDNSKLYKMVEQAGAVINWPIFSQYSKGATESGFMSTILGVPSICSMGPEGGQLHAPDEFMLVSSFLPKCEIIALTALQAAHGFKPAEK